VWSGLIAARTEIFSDAAKQVPSFKSRGAVVPLDVKFEFSI
jgi:hypothetical protein